MIEFKGSQFERGLILRASAGIWPTSFSYRQLEEMLEKLGIEVDHSALKRLVAEIFSLCALRGRQHIEHGTGGGRVAGTA